MKEKDFLARLLPRLAQGRDVRVGPGDDCALVEFGGELLLLAVDQVVAGVHFANDARPEQVGRKLLCRNLSDIAAMGGEPLHALVAVATGRAGTAWLDRFMAGIERAARQWRVSVVGGDLATLPGPGLVASLTITGRVPRGKVCRRAGAKPGDRLLATGTFGNAIASGHHLSFTPRLREGQFLSKGGWVRAMIDVSDGLLSDAAALARASGLTLTIEPQKVPRRRGASLAAALGEGEDYELLCAVPARRVPALLQAWPFPDAPLAVIGELVAGKPGTVRDPAGKNLIAAYRAGWDHEIGK